MESNLIWITGASSGIGRAITLLYAKKGWELILTSRNLEKLEELSGTCRKEGARNCWAYKMDMESPKEIDEVSKAILAKHPCPKILIHSAGISQRSLVLETGMEVYRRIMEIDYFGLIHLTKKVVPVMIENGGGKMVVISSLTGKFSTPLRSGYAAAKHALHGFFDALRTENRKDNIRVCIICPGFIKTNVSINALIGNGQKQNIMDDAQSKGMSPERFAQKAYLAISRNKDEVYIGGKEVLGVYLSRFFPKIFRNLIIGRSKIN